MPNGDPGLPNPGELPGDEPPPYIEGPTGGPAMPYGGGGAWTKAGAADYQQNMGVMTGILGMAAGFALIAGWVVGAVALGVVAVVTGLEADKAGDIVRDPPKPYEQPVIFQRRVSNPPGRQDPIASLLGLASQYGVTAMVTMQGLLDALERGEGARRDGNIDWAVAHTGVTRIATKTMDINLAYQAWAMTSAAAALKGTAHDVVIPAGDIGPLQKALADPKIVQQWRQAGLDAGLMDAEIDRGLDRLRAIKPLAQGGRLSELLDRTARTIYATAYKRVQDPR
jgi:hypothetical protein